VVVEPCEAEVAELAVHVAVKEHVGGLDVAVHHHLLPPLVQVQQPGGDVPDDLGTLLPAQSRLVAAGAEQALVEAAVDHVVVDEQQLAPPPAVAEELDQVAVAQPAQAGDLRDELAQALPRVLGHLLDGDLDTARLRREHAAVHDAEAAAADDVAETPGGGVQVPVADPVRAVLDLPVLLLLGEPPAAPDDA